MIYTRKHRYCPSCSPNIRMSILSMRISRCSEWFTYALSLNPNAAFFPVLVIFFVEYHLCLNVHISKSLAVFSYVCAIMSVFCNTANGIEAVIDPTGGAVSASLTNGLLQLGISTAAVVVLFRPIGRYGGFLINNMDIPRIWYITVLISGIILFVNVGMVPEKYETLHTNNVFRVYWTLQIMFAAMEILLSVIFYSIVEGMLNTARLEQRSRFLEMQESQYIKQQKYIEDTARARHDFKQTIRALNAMAADDDLKSIKEYLGEYVNTIPEKDTVSYCKNNAVNALLNYYSHAAMTNSTELVWNIDLPEDIGINETDMCSVIGNILDNAVTACKDVAVGKRFIQLGITVRNDANLYIVVSNSFNGKVRQKDGRYLSTHRNGSGIGLSSVISIAENNGGTARFRHDENEFYSDVMMKVKKADQTVPQSGTKR